MRLSVLVGGLVAVAQNCSKPSAKINIVSTCCDAAKSPSGQILVLPHRGTDDGFTPISGPYLELIDWPKSAISGCEQMQQTTFSSLPRWIRN